MLSKKVLKERFREAITYDVELKLTTALLLYDIKELLTPIEPAKKKK